MVKDLTNPVLDLDRIPQGQAEETKVNRFGANSAPTGIQGLRQVAFLFSPFFLYFHLKSKRNSLENNSHSHFHNSKLTTVYVLGTIFSFVNKGVGLSDGQAPFQLNIL